MTREVQVYGLFLKSVNRIKYVGITQNSLHTRRLEHIRGKKLDANDVEIRLLAVCATKEEAAKVEAELIKQYDTIHNGFNVSPYITSGNANAKSEEERVRISAAMKGRAKPRTEVLARVGKKKKDNGLPANVLPASRKAGRFIVQIKGVKGNKTTNFSFGTYNSVEEAEIVAKAVAEYSKQNNMILDGFTHPLWIREVREKNPELYGIMISKYNTYNVQLRCKVNKKLYGFKSWKTLEQATTVRDAAVEYYKQHGTYEGFVIPKV